MMRTADCLKTVNLMENGSVIPLWTGWTEMCGNISAANGWRLIRFMRWDFIVSAAWAVLWRVRTDGQSFVVSYLPAGVYTGIWEDAGCDSFWWREDKVEDAGGRVLLVDGGEDDRGADQFV